MLGHFDNLSKYNKYKAIFIFLLIIIALAFSTTNKPNLGINDSNQLKPCPNKQSCINTEYTSNADNYVKPFSFSLDKADSILKQSKDIILSMNAYLARLLFDLCF